MSFTLRAKRTLVGALAMTMVISLMPAGVASADEHGEVCDNAGDAGFTDTSASVHEDNINCMFAYGIGSGYDDDTFRPGNPITRDQMATLLASFAVVANEDLDIPDVDVPFTDIEGNVHAANIEALYALGVVSGQTETTYNPRGLVTRAQYATFVVQAHEALGVDFDVLLDEVDSPFTDIAGDTHEANIEILFSAELVVGQTATTYNPAGSVQRGQVMTVLANSAAILDANDLWDAPRLPEVVDPEDPFADNRTENAAPELVRVNRTETVGIVEYIFDDLVTGQALQRVVFGEVGNTDGHVELFPAAATEEEAGDACLDIGTRNYDHDARTCFLYQDFLLYDADGNAAWPYEASISGDTVRTRYSDSASALDIPAVAGQDNEIVDNAVRGTVRWNAVENVQRVPSIAGDFPLRVSDETTTATNPFEPQLLSVTDRGASSLSFDGEPLTLVDFNFDDEIAGLGLLDVEDGDIDAGEFVIVGRNGREFRGLTFVTGRDTPAEAINQPAQTSSSVTIAFSQELSEVPESTLSYGYVVTGDTTATPAISDLKNLFGTDGNVVLSASYVGGTDGTVNPDIVRAERVTADRIQVTFDQEISDNVGDFDATQFFAYFGNQDPATAQVVAGVDAFPSATVAEAGLSIVVEFAPGDLGDFDELENRPVGIYVGDGAVTGTVTPGTSTAGENRPAGVGLAIPDPETEVGEDFGITARPDLESIEVAINSVTGNYQVVFEFNESVTAVLPQTTFYLYAADGTRFEVDGSTTQGRSIQSGGERIVFSVDDGFTQLSNEQIEVAETGAVQTTSLLDLFNESLTTGPTVRDLPTEGQLYFD